MDLIYPLRFTTNFRYYMRKGPFMIVLNRSTIFIISIVWLSTSLISTQITSQYAHALIFDASISDYPTSKSFYHTEKRIENIGRKSERDISEFIETTNIISDQTNYFWINNKFTTTLQCPFIPYHSSILLTNSHLITTDYWLNIPPGTIVIDNYGTNDVEVSSWVRTNLGEIDLKGNTFPDSFYKLQTDLFDPSQLIVNKFFSNFLLIVSILIFMLFFTCSGLVFLDRYVFRTVLQNCLRLDKNISWNRTKKEIRRWSQFVLKILMIIILYLIINAGFLFMCHKYIVPIPTVIKIFSAFNIDPVVWERNIEIGIYGDIGEDYERWSENQNFSPKMARFWQEFLWNNWYILIALMLYFGASFYLSVLKISMGFFKHYKKGVVRRKYFYYSVDRSRLAKKKLA